MVQFKPTDISARDLGDWQSLFPHFRLDRVWCHCPSCETKRRRDNDILGTLGVTKEAMTALERIRCALAIPLVINSGYRCLKHPIEAKKSPSTARHSHSRGYAFDVKVSGYDAFQLVSACKEHGFNGIGVKQNGEWAKRFIHIDRRQDAAIWSY